MHLPGAGSNLGPLDYIIFLQKVDLDATKDDALSRYRASGAWAPATHWAEHAERRIGPRPRWSSSAPIEGGIALNPERRAEPTRPRQRPCRRGEEFRIFPNAGP